MVCTKEDLIPKITQFISPNDLIVFLYVLISHLVKSFVGNTLLEEKLELCEMPPEISKRWYYQDTKRYQ